MENKVVMQSNYADANGNILATSAGAGCVSPNLPATEISTCQPSVCGGSTCASTCYNTCGNTCVSTCMSTCQSTCANTCANTCGSKCYVTYYFDGNCYWYYPYNGTENNNWAASPDPCYENNAGSVNCWFDDESAPGTPISGVNYNNGYYSGSKSRASTNAGANLQQVAILWNGSPYPVQYLGDTGHWGGPLTPNHWYQGNLVLEEW